MFPGVGQRCLKPWKARLPWCCRALDCVYFGIICAWDVYADLGVDEELQC